MRVRSRLAGGVLGTAVAVLMPVAAEAGRYCGDPLQGAERSGITQEEALIAAQKGWSLQAERLGRGYESWDTADDRSLECSKTGDGTFRCKAAGRPCLPAGKLPEPRRRIDM